MTTPARHVVTNRIITPKMFSSTELEQLKQTCINKAVSVPWLLVRWCILLGYCRCPIQIMLHINLYHHDITTLILFTFFLEVIAELGALQKN